MRLARLVTAAALLLVAPLAIAQTCAPDLGGAKILESLQYVIAYRTAPNTIPMGRHFTLDLVVCARESASPPSAVQVDAHMPEHGHGMNYKAVVKPVGRGRYTVEGLMFHMPGRWELLFDIRTEGGHARLTDTIVLQ